MTMIKTRWHGFCTPLTLALALTLVVYCTWSVSKQQTPVANLLTSADRWTRQPLPPIPPIYFAQSLSAAKRRSISALNIYRSLLRCVAIATVFTHFPVVSVSEQDRLSHYRHHQRRDGRRMEKRQVRVRIQRERHQRRRRFHGKIQVRPSGVCRSLHTLSLRPNPVNDIVTAHLWCFFCLDTPQRSRVDHRQRGVQVRLHVQALQGAGRAGREVSREGIENTGFPVQPIWRPGKHLIIWHRGSVHCHSCTW